MKLTNIVLLIWSVGIALGVDVEYKPGYDPAKPPAGGVGVIAEELWGEAVNGLQAALAAPAKLRLNEEGVIHLVVRNVSDQPIKALFRDQPDLRLEPEAQQHMQYSVNRSSDKVTRWQIAPGHQIALRCAPLYVKAPGVIGPKNTMESIKPGSHRLISRTSAGGTYWVSSGGNRPAVEVVTLDGEWRGRVKAKPQDLEVLDEKVAYPITPPAELNLKPGQVLKPVFDRPKLVNNFKHEEYKLRRANLYLDSERDAHWIWHYGRYDSEVYWGPFSEQDLEELGLADLMEKQVREGFTGAPYFYNAWSRIAKMISRSKPFAERGLKMIPSIEIPEGDPNKSFEEGTRYWLVRTIRNRRVELREMGLEKEAIAALESLDPKESPLPEAAQFKVIANGKVPAGLKEDAWGPENQGLRAAALGPAEVRDGEILTVRLFIRNVSEMAIFMTVSNRAGYDFITAVDPDGKKLETAHTRPHSNFIMANGIWPERDPGAFTQNPPVATLTKCKLEAGAVWELDTKTSISYYTTISPPLGNGFRALNGPASDEPGAPAVSSIISKQPVEALVTWELHTANGFEHSKDLKVRLWPAKGGWSGILTTAPAKVKLLPKAD